MNHDTFYDLFPAFLRTDPAWEARKDRLWAMTPHERVTAMRAGTLSYRELAHWSALRPDEVPRLSTGTGINGGEFEWIAMFTPEIAEADDPTASDHDNHATRPRTARS